MKQRLVLMLMVFALVLAVAPLAMADHCRTCRFGNCVVATLPAYYFCEDLGSTCSLTVACSGPHPFTEETFAAEFTVASVERLDDQQQPSPSEQTRVASLETPTPAHP
jgi:hypothetical protein